MKYIFVMMLIGAALFASPAMAQVAWLVDADRVPVGTIVDLNFDGEVINRGALVAVEAGGQMGVLITNDAVGTLAFTYDIYFVDDGCTGTGFVAILDASEFALRGNFFAVAGEAGDLYLLGDQTAQVDTPVESQWDSSAGSCIDISGPGMFSGALTLIEAGFAEQFRPPFRVEAYPQGMMNPVAAPAVGLPGLLLLVLGLMLLGGFALSRKLARPRP